MIKNIFAIFAGVFVGLALLLFALSFLGGKSLFKTQPTAKAGNKTFDLEIAKTTQELQKGLSNRKSLPENKAMLFIFPKPDYYAFWMKDMQFPLDIIFLNGNKIVMVYKNVPPPSSADQALPIYKPEAPSDKVLEINAGLADKYNIQKGATVTFNNL